MKKQQGFTLIELMIVVAIVAILAAIAMPSYSAYVEKSNRSDAKIALMRISQMQESFFAQNMTYAQDLTTGSGGLGLGATVKSDEEFYSIALTKIPNTCNGTNTAPCTGFTIKATPIAGGRQAGDDTCKGFSINHLGKREGMDSANTTYDIAKGKKCW
jgi:type IV pilus assembly protein PilE